MILSNTTEPPSALTCSETDPTKVFFKPLSDPLATITTAEPNAVTQVFFVSRLPTNSAKFSFKSAYDKYLTSDKFGIVSSSVEAVDLLRICERNISLWEEDVARADSGTVGFREVFKIRCHAQNKAKVKRKKVDPIDLDASAFEAEQIKKFQSWGGGRRVLSSEDAKDLKKAAKTGYINEALLDRREKFSKLKADKFCK
ncbi:hypothetical protein BC829DRAFT_437199 [Chytridium lagenaria]|nr:hypothetical protein BC829DRAFT_437199 [Chytridium lagenaria]